MEVNVSHWHKNYLSLLLIFITFLHITSSEVSAKESKVLNIFLIQNSGWMEPFYVDNNSQIKSLVKLVIDKVNPYCNEMAVASFNQSTGDNKSPLLVYQGKDKDKSIKAAWNINLAKKAGGKIFADTDFKEAVTSAIRQYSPGRPCILWIITNNKNSPGNSPETAVKNREFYRWLQAEDNIKRIVAYTYPMPVQGAYYKANGLMIYAMAYGKQANIVLENIIDANIPFQDKPARLKPLNADAITFVPTSVANKGNFSASLASDRSTLLISFDSSNKPEVAVINGVFRNDFYPYDIMSANVSLETTFIGDSHGIQSLIQPKEVTFIPAGKESTLFLVKTGIPSLPGIWSHPEIIFKSGYKAQAMMVFKLTNQQLRLSPTFQKRMNELFPGDPLPEIFIPGESAKQSESIRPLVVNVVYPAWPLVVIVLLLLAVIFGGIWLLSIFTSPKKYTIIVDGGLQKTCLLRAFTESTLYSDRNDKIGILKRGLGKPTVKLDNGCNNHVQVI